MFKILNGFLSLGSMLPTKFRDIVEACDAARGVGLDEVIQKAQYKYMKEVSSCVLRPLKIMVSTSSFACPAELSDAWIRGAV